MTQTGKCDVCRQRKVKCGEEKPKCGACRKKDRLCTYSYGKPSAFVVQDPNQLTKHGKSKVAPVIYALDSSEKIECSTVSTASDLHITTEREAENGQGVFQTLAPILKRKPVTSRRSVILQRRKLGLYLQHLQAEAAISSIIPTSPETTLIARYIDMIGKERTGNQPLSILGTWIESIPSRIGSNRMMDLAVEFFVNGHAVYCDNTHSKRILASASKEKALKELQLFVLNANNKPTYEVLLATKMHYAAEALLGIDTMFHAIHAFGLAELLKSGIVANVDDEHFWNLIDNTYIDDVNEAMLADRTSVYDNDFYLSSTYPPPLSSNAIVLSASQRASMATMHVFIQCPRLNILIRHAVADQDDTTALVAAITLAESMWQFDLAEQVAPLLHEAVVLSPRPVAGLADVISESYDFNSVQSMVSCTRYWMLMIIMGGLIDTLYRYFPMETAMSHLPDRYAMHQIETDAAKSLIMSMPWSELLSQKLPLVPLRLHTPLQISIGAWYRTIKRLNAVRATIPDLDADVQLEIDRIVAHAHRMKSYIIVECNEIHRRWDVSIVSEKPLLEALDAMAGEKIPDWLPIRVRFEAEQGEMCIKLDYQNKAGWYHDSYDLTERSPKLVTDNHAAAWQQEAGVVVGQTKLPFRGDGPDAPIYWPAAERSMDLRGVANFVHETGRNLCSTSGWWPSSEPSAYTLLDSTHKASAFAPLLPQNNHSGENAPGHVDRHPCLASSFWPSIPISTTATNSMPKQSCLSPAWSSPIPQRARVLEGSTEARNPTPTSSSSGLNTPLSYEPCNIRE